MKEPINNQDDEPYLDCIPTSTLVGSRERIETYRQRYEAGERLHHIQDCKLREPPSAKRPQSGYAGLRVILTQDLEYGMHDGE